MNMHSRTLKTLWFGTFVLQDGEIVDSILFPNDPSSIAQRLMAVSEKKVLKEESDLVKRAKPTSSDDPRLESLGLETVDIDVSIDPISFGFQPDLLAKASMQIGTVRSRESITPDKFVVQALESYDSLIEVQNIITERVKYYYSLHWPELVDKMPEERYLELIVKYGTKDEIEGSGEKKLPQSKGFGTGIPPMHLDAVKDLAKLVLQVQDSRNNLEETINRGMETAAPNVHAVAGGLVGARLISLVGGLERMASLPSSTIQVLGAEKAMFRAKTENARKPKHGVIFMHPLIHSSPHWVRGKIARAMAGKISIAAKVDLYGGDFIGDKLRSELESKVTAIRKRHPNPPKKKGSGKKGRKP